MNSFRRFLFATAALFLSLGSACIQAQTFEVFFSDNEGRNPESGLVEVSEGVFLGTTYDGGVNGGGTVFKITSSGTHTVLHNFGGAKGSRPAGTLIRGSDGAFYGTTEYGGSVFSGTVYKITIDGTHTLLHSFDPFSGFGGRPCAGLVQGSDGEFYGTTLGGGNSNTGTVFKISASGTMSVLHKFNFYDGRHPYAGLVQSRNGDFYGTTYSGGTNADLSFGTVFKITASGAFTMLHSFNYPTVGHLRAELIQGTDGDFYGITADTVFKITSSGIHTVLHTFNGSNGSQPAAGLVLGSDGCFYGSTEYGGTENHGTVFKITANGAHTVLHSFNGSNGRSPTAELVQGTDGHFYGTTRSGGANDCGTVFKITASGEHSVLHSFSGTNGRNPNPVLQGSDENFYGTTNGDGTANDIGTIFKLTTSGAYEVLHKYNGTNGNRPSGSLIQDSEGNFYGTTSSGGTNGGGTVFKFNASGTHNVLHNFSGSDGRGPSSGVVQGSDGHLYGTTRDGGNSNHGTVFKLTTSGAHTLLHSFDGSTGRSPAGGLVLASDGNFYGTTTEGGASNFGTVFKITASGTHSVLHSFNNANGGYPFAGLVQGIDGDFYGTTNQGGAKGHGTVYKITASGTHTLLHSFNGSDGRNPSAGLVQNYEGNFYGTTSYGGANDLGTIFKITASGKISLLHSFDGSQANQPRGTPSFGSDGLLYGSAKNMVVWRMSVEAPELVIRGNGNVIVGGDDPPNEADHTDFGEINILAEPITRTYAISNTGNLPLLLTGLPKVQVSGAHASDFAVTMQPVSPVEVEDSTSFTITFDPTDVGVRTAKVAISSNMSGTPLFTFAIQGTASGSVMMALSGNGQDIVNGDDTPSEADHTYFGAVNITAEAAIRTFTITNTGELPLLLTGSPKVQISGGHASDFAVTMQPDSPLAVAEQAPFTITYTPTGSGVRTAMVSIASNAPDHPVYSFIVQGMGVLLPAIILSGNGLEIPNEDVIPNLEDHTDFGSVSQALGVSTRKFIITNTGDLPLQLTGASRVEISGTHTADFRVSIQPDSPVAAGEAAAFTVAFDPSGAGVRSAVVSITSDASNAPFFTFAIQGTGTGTPDTKNPTLKLATPAGRAVSSSSPLTVAGVAGDDFAVARVEVVLNGGEVVLADLIHGSKPSSVPFSMQITPIVGENTLTVTAYDPSGNSTTLTRVFNFGRRYVLTLLREVPEVWEAMPDKAGTVALKAAIAKNATALTKGSPQTSQVLPDTMLSLTAAAKVGHLFSHWSGLPGGAQARGNVAAFMMPVADTGVTAVFVANPLTQGAMAALGSKPVFQGLLRPDETTLPGNDTVGFLSAALVPSKGSLSGKLWMDGQVVPFTGALHGDGSVWFKVGRDLAAALPFAGRELTMSWSESGLATSVTRTVNEVTHVSTGLAKAPRYSRAAPVRGALLDDKGRQGYFTLALPTVTQDPVKPSVEYPQGSGHAGLTLLANGTLKLAGMLAEGTKITAASFLVEGDAAEVFVVLPTPGGRTKQGSLLGTLAFDEAQADTDVTSADMQWFRPVAETKPAVVQAYRAGWPGGIRLGVIGALYDGTLPMQSALGLAVTAPGGNAALVFQDGNLADEVGVTFNLDGNRVVKLNARDNTWSLRLATKTGIMSGTFTPNWPDAVKKLPTFSGMLLQKGTNAGGLGFFLSNAAGDMEPKSGAVELESP